jgi:hypothetical protein
MGGILCCECFQLKKRRSDSSSFTEMFVLNIHLYLLEVFKINQEIINK